MLPGPKLATAALEFLENAKSLDNAVGAPDQRRFLSSGQTTDQRQERPWAAGRSLCLRWDNRQGLLVAYREWGVCPTEYLHKLRTVKNGVQNDLVRRPGRQKQKCDNKPISKNGTDLVPGHVRTWRLGSPVLAIVGQLLRFPSSDRFCSVKSLALLEDGAKRKNPTAVRGRETLLPWYALLLRYLHILRTKFIWVSHFSAERFQSEHCTLDRERLYFLKKKGPSASATAASVQAIL